MKLIRPALLIPTLALTASAPSWADVLLIDSIQSAPEIKTPHTGISMTQVREQYGAPTSEQAAIGEPPITRWEYDGYSVFFEHDLVLHSVIHHPGNTAVN